MNSLSRAVTSRRSSFRLRLHMSAQSKGDMRSGESLGPEATVTAVVSAGAREAKGKEGGIPCSRGLTTQQRSLTASLLPLEAALRTSGCQHPSPRPPWALQRTLSLQIHAISLRKAQGRPTTRKQSYNSHPTATKQGKHCEPEVGSRKSARARRTCADTLVGRSGAGCRQWRSWGRQTKRNCSAWWRPNSRRHSSLHRYGDKDQRKEK